jgi:hypothetical protein
LSRAALQLNHQQVQTSPLLVTSAQVRHELLVGLFKHDGANALLDGHVHVDMR